MNFDQELTILSDTQIFGLLEGLGQLKVLKKYGTRAAVTDLVILLGHAAAKYLVPDDKSLKGRTGNYYTSSCNDLYYYSSVEAVDAEGYGFKETPDTGPDCFTIRPALQSPKFFATISSLKRIKGYNGTEEVAYGEYPQYAPMIDVQIQLEQELKMGRLYKTGKNYTFNSPGSQCFQPMTYDEYEYDGKKFIRIKATKDDCKLSNGLQYMAGDNVWVEVSPVMWLVDDKTKTLVSKRCLLTGIIFHDKQYYGNFSKTKMKEYLDKYMLKDLIPSSLLTPKEKAKYEEEVKKAKSSINPYKFELDQVSEEEIIKGAIESGIAVFLHGESSEGKSARVRQIDPDCVIIYLRNATPESLNGKSVYNSETGEMIDVKPTWLKKLEAKCEAEPDKLHIVFFDEITNALPSIQGIAFNIVLDREVNGMWQLPKNARIVAAGNEMKDSLAANQLAEPLFNRFAHVYIKTTTEGWLKWASENNIHPAIYSYIAYKKGTTLRSKYNGETPNADPRKWEMASKMLYATKNPEMLRALVGEEITREFVEFCYQQVITLEDVINGNYNEEYVQSLNTASRYATTMGLTQVDEENMEKVRNFAINLGPEFGAIFDSLWAHGDESRLELIAEARLANLESREL